jgi:hypothetical protein
MYNDNITAHMITRFAYSEMYLDTFLFRGKVVATRILQLEPKHDDLWCAWMSVFLALDDQLHVALEAGSTALPIGGY